MSLPRLRDAAVFTAAVAFSASTLITAQTQSQTRPPTGAPQTPRTGGNQTMQVTGCLTRDQAGTFMLTNGRKANDSPTGTPQRSPEDPRVTPPAAASPSGPPRADALKYTLETTTASLEPHVGHQVELTGHLSAPLADPRAIAGATGTSGADVAPAAPSSGTVSRGTAAGEAPAPGFVVDAVKMLAPSCQPQAR